MHDSTTASATSAGSATVWFSRAGLPVVCAAALALFHLAWVLAHFAPATMSPDANGYVVQARLLATEGRTYLTTDSPVQFVGMHWLETGSGVFHSRYPAGLPVIFALAWKLGGLRAALLVNPLLASGTVLLTFFLARRFTGGWSALLAAAVVATNATAQQHALDADAHTAAAFFLIAGVLALLCFADHPVPWRGLLTGGLLGIVPTVRYPEAIAGIAVGGWLLWRVRPAWRVWPAVLGAALPLGVLLVHNASAYGAFWRTGYALTGEQTGFGWNYFTEHALPYLQSLGGAGFGLFFAFSAAGLAAMVVDVRRRATGVLFVGIVVPLVLLYMAYYFGAGDGNLRFLVPTFPLLAAAGAWLLARMCATFGGAGRAVWITVAVLQLGVAGAVAVQTTARMHTSLQAAAQTRALLKREATAGSVVIVEHQLGESLDATGEWRLVEENLVSGGAAGGAGGGLMRLRRAGAPGGAPGLNGLVAAGAGQPSPQQANRNLAQRARYANMSAAERQARVWADIRTWAGDRPVYWLVRSLDTLDAALPAWADYVSVGEIDASAMAMMGGGPGMIGPGGGRGGVPGGGPMGGGFAPGAVGPPLRNGPGDLTGGPGGGSGGARLQAQNQKLRLVRIVFAKN